jgi:hypothetical protein
VNRIRIGEALVLLYPPQNSDRCCKAHLLLRGKTYAMGESSSPRCPYSRAIPSPISLSQHPYLMFWVSEKHCVFFVSDLVETQPNTVGRLAALKALAHLESDIGLLQLGR